MFRRKLYLIALDFIESISHFTDYIQKKTSITIFITLFLGETFVFVLIVPFGYNLSGRNKSKNTKSFV